jgi:hypothetical protein
MGSIFRNLLDEELIPVRGVVHLYTSLGVFLDENGRRIFVPSGQTRSPLRGLTTGDVVTLYVNRDYALREGLVALRTREPMTPG